MMKNNIVVLSHKAKKEMANYEQTTPRCKSCESHKFNGNNAGSICMKFGFPVSASGVCDFWIDQTTKIGLTN